MILWTGGVDDLKVEILQFENDFILNFGTKISFFFFLKNNSKLRKIWFLTLETPKKGKVLT